MTAMSLLPRRARGRISAADETLYQSRVDEFCELIRGIQKTLDFKVSSRGWCYILEDRIGLLKGEFDKAQDLVNACRKSGKLPLDICADDETRSTLHVPYCSKETPACFAQDIIERIRWAHLGYAPFMIWDDLDVYVEMFVEKVDLKNLFEPVCRHFQVPLTNAKGWSDINSRADMIERFAEWESKGKQCVLLLCGDHDPGGLAISGFMRSNLADLTLATGFDPSNLVITRFGLNLDFIEGNRLSWIENLETSSGRRLDDPRHPDHNREYVRNYIRQFGVRKVEANALSWCAPKPGVSYAGKPSYSTSLPTRSETTRGSCARLRPKCETTFAAC